jgi:Uma2 family endonuclease
MRNKDRIDLPQDPPPDLVVEIDITHHEIDREEIYADLGVGELWLFDGQHLTAFALRRGKYVPIENSLAFPMLKVRDLEPFLLSIGKVDQTTVRRQFRDWIRKSPPGT